MENKYLDFLGTKGYSKSDILKVKLERYLDFFDGQQDLLYETLILNIKEKLGVIKEQDYDFLTSYKDYFFKDINIDMYYKNINVALNKLRNIDNKNMNRKDKFSPNYTFRYFFGVLLSSYLLTRDDELVTNRVLHLNNKLSNNEIISFFDGFEILGINIQDNAISDSLIESVSIYYDEVLDKTLLLEAKQKR